MDTEVLLEVKPKYVDWVRALANSVSPGFITFWILILCCSPVLMVPIVFMAEKGYSIVFSILTVVAVILAIFLFSLSITLFFDKKNFEATNYKVYGDRIEFEEGFINHKYTTIRMTDIKEIHLEQNFIQRKAELGTIRFITAANNSTTLTGVCFRDIEYSKAVYAKVKQIHENS